MFVLEPGRARLAKTANKSVPHVILLNETNFTKKKVCSAFPLNRGHTKLFFLLTFSANKMDPRLNDAKHVVFIYPMKQMLPNVPAWVKVSASLPWAPDIC